MYFYSYIVAVSEDILSHASLLTLSQRPGPYINAEASGGGFPGWLSRSPGILRTRDPRFLNATDNYSRHIGEIIAKAQITEGGPVILYQPENEYSQAVPSDTDFPDGVSLLYILFCISSGAQLAESTSETPIFEIR